MDTYSNIIDSWYTLKGWEQYDFQQQLAQAYAEGYNGLLNAPTGSGKTYAMWLPVICSRLAEHGNAATGNLRVLWVTPLRALAKDIARALQDACDILGLEWKVELRTGDVSSAVKQRQKKQMPECLVITPESMHVLFCDIGHATLFSHVECIIVDEWHELLGSKRGVQTELAIAHIRSIVEKENRELRIWGISATIGNLVEAMEVLMGPQHALKKTTIVRAGHKKKMEVHTVLPPSIEVLPWSGHIGLRLLPDIIRIVHQAQTTLIFTNTRAMAEIWYHQILQYDESLAGVLAMHHGSLSTEVRDWVEENLHAGTLKAVICTSSLDLGVDFRPVDAVIQIGSPKGVARFTQRAGRSGHSPGAISRIWFIPTHALELVEIAAIKEALELDKVEKREPMILCFDVLMQYLVTLSVGSGFYPAEIFAEVHSTHAFHAMQKEEWEMLLLLITKGGAAFHAYDDFSRVGKVGEKYHIINKNAARKHRLSIGTIVSDPVVRVSYLKGGTLGTIEEYFIASLKQGDVFWFAGHCLEFIMLKEMTAFVRKTQEKKAITASYMGGRMPLSSYMAERMRMQLEKASDKKAEGPEYALLMPLLDLQRERSKIPRMDELLVELCTDDDGFHIFFYPFEGRVVHEVMASLTAFRLSAIRPISISVAMNDYGFELLCNNEVEITEQVVRTLFDLRNMESDLFNSLNATEMAKRKFRDISIISGMIFQGYPGEQKRSRHLQSSSELLFKVLREYDPSNLLLRQSYDEILYGQMENARMRSALMRIANAQIQILATEKFSPFAFPIVVDSLRDRLTSERLSDRIKNMLAEHH